MVFHGIDILRKPPNSVIVARNYEIGGSIGSFGRQQLAFRVRISPASTSTVGYFTVIMNIDVVPEC
jgi:hypothetical protein